MRDTIGPRLRDMQKRRSALKSAAIGEQDAPETGFVALMRRATEMLKLRGTAEETRASLRLAQAGIRSEQAVIRYMFMRFALPFVFGVVGILLVYVVNAFPLPGPLKLPVVMALVVFGAFAPNIYITNAKIKRQQALTKSLPDALDLMIICVEAGLSIDAAFHRIAREFSKGSPELADEFGLTAIELTFMPERRLAFDNLNRRTDLEQIRGIVTALRQTEKFGTPLAQSLRVLASEYRQTRMMKAEEKAARLPAIMTVPMVVFILPCVFVVLIGPAILSLVDNLSRF
jgi:tight adherence protein C